MWHEHNTGPKMEIKIALRAIACVEINKNMQKIEIKIAMRVSSKKKKKKVALRAIVCVLVLN